VPVGAEWRVDMPQCVNDAWQYLKDHDASNWFVIIVSIFVWPAILSIFFVWWANRKRQSVPHFLVTFTPSNSNIGQATYDAVLFTFINQTGSITYLYHARLTENQKYFPIPAAASRDMARGWRELVFALPPEPPQTDLSFEVYECVLQTDPKSGRVFASMAVKQPMDDAFYSYRPTLLRKWFGALSISCLSMTLWLVRKSFPSRQSIECSLGSIF